jgi:hypothetical protein
MITICTQQMDYSTTLVQHARKTHGRGANIWYACSKLRRYIKIIKLMSSRLINMKNTAFYSLVGLALLALSEVRIKK